MRVLIVDNYDSFTFNLRQYLGSLGADVLVEKNDRIDLSGIRALGVDRVVLSPGPGRPERAADFGVCADVIADLEDVPILGVCLGHQGIVHHYGGRIEHAPEVFHGKTSFIRHDGSALFAGLPARLEVMRYHSLIAAEEAWPDALVVTARTDDEAGLVMACAHRSRPLWGIQFHPESIGSPEGMAVLERFLRA